MAKKKKSPVTPIRPCIYPFLKKPDTRWKKDGEYKVSLIFDQDDPFIAKIEKKAQKEFEAAKENMKPADKKIAELISPVTEEMDEDGKPTGNVKLNFKSNAQFIDKKTEEVVKVTMKVFNSQGGAIKDLPNIGNGSKLAISFKPIGTVMVSDSKKHGREVNCYLSLWMNAVQLVDLKEYTPDGSSYGFGKEEGGYESDGSDFDDPDTTVKDPNTDDDDDF